MLRDPPIPKLPAEPTFNQIVQLVGGERVDSMVGCLHNLENADYCFRSDGVIAELKEITYDARTDPAMVERVSAIYNMHAHRPDMPLVFGKAPIRIDLLPEDVRREVLNIFKRKLENPVKKAARQIKETKIQLQMPEAHGLLILVNEASTFLRPDLAFFLLHHILKNQYRSIDHVIYCSINMLLKVPGAPAGARFWAAAAVEGRRPIRDQFISRLSTAFVNVLDDQTGVPSVQVNCDPDVAASRSFIATPHAADDGFFVQPGKFYHDDTTGFSYYCESVAGGTANMWLVESIQGGKLVQAKYSQKLLHANRSTYAQVTNGPEIDRLRALLKTLRRQDRRES